MRRTVLLSLSGSPWGVFMSLTIEAYNERKWSRYPSLRNVLEDRKIPDHYYGPTSVSDNIFERLSRLHQLAVLVCEHKDQLIDKSESCKLKEMMEDLNLVKQDLESARCGLEKYIRDIDQICTLIGEKQHTR